MGHTQLADSGYPVQEPSACGQVIASRAQRALCMLAAAGVTTVAAPAQEPLVPQGLPVPTVFTPLDQPGPHLPDSCCFSSLGLKSP